MTNALFIDLEILIRITNTPRRRRLPRPALPPPTAGKRRRGLPPRQGPQERCWHRRVAPALLLRVLPPCCCCCPDAAHVAHAFPLAALLPCCCLVAAQVLLCWLVGLHHTATLPRATPPWIESPSPHTECGADPRDRSLSAIRSTAAPPPTCMAPCLRHAWRASPAPDLAVGDETVLTLGGEVIKVKVKVGKSLHRLNFPVLTSSFRPLFDLPDAPSAVPPTSSEWVPGRPVPKPWRF